MPGALDVLRRSSCCLCSGRLRGLFVDSQVLSLREPLDAIVGQSEVSLKMCHSGLKGEVLVFRCPRLRFGRCVGCFACFFLLLVFWSVEGHVW